MSLASSRPPQLDLPRNSQNQSIQNGDIKPDPNQKPIMRLMRQQQSYLLQHTQPSPTLPRQTSNITPTGQLKNLKQFQRSLQKQRPNQIQIPNSNHNNNSFNSSTIKSSNMDTPRAQFREKLVSSFIINESTIPNQEDDERAFHHRMTETQKYGNQNIEKLRSFIVDQNKSPQNPKRNKTKEKLNYFNLHHSYQATSSTQKLHKSYLKTQQDRRNQYIKKLHAQEIKQVRPFKIQNQMSKFLAQKRAQKQGGSHKPLYQRSIQLAKQIQQARLEKQMQAQEQRRLKKQQQDRQFDQMQKQRHPNANTKQRQEQFYNQMMQRQKQKNQLKQQQKIQHIKQATKQKPFVTKASQDLFNKIIQKKDIPKDFIQRNLEYRAQRQKQKIKQMQNHDKQYCPFAPKISQASRQIAKNYYERKQKNLQGAHKNCLKDSMLQKQQLQKKLKSIGEKIDQKKNSGQSNTKKHQRTSSELPIGIKAFTARDKPCKSVGKIKHVRDEPIHTKRAEVKQQEIPIYNRSDYGNRRTSSCFNLKDKK